MTPAVSIRLMTRRRKGRLWSEEIRRPASTGNLCPSWRSGGALGRNCPASIRATRPMPNLPRYETWHSVLLQSSGPMNLAPYPAPTPNRHLLTSCEPGTLCMVTYSVNLALCHLVLHHHQVRGDRRVLLTGDGAETRGCLVRLAGHKKAGRTSNHDGSLPAEHTGSRIRVVSRSRIHILAGLEVSRQRCESPDVLDPASGCRNKLCRY